MLTLCCAVLVWLSSDPGILPFLGLAATQFLLYSVNICEVTQARFLSSVLQTMDMTLAELHDAVNHRLSVAPTQPVSDFPIQEVTVHLVKTPDASSVRDAASASRYSFSEGKVSEGYGVTCR